MGGKAVAVEADVARMHELFDAANRACNEGESTSDFEPAFVGLLTYLEQHPDCSLDAERRFVEGVLEGTLCWELVSFAMHKLRLEPVRRETARAIGASRDPRDATALSHVLDAFDDAWNGTEMYAYYRGKSW